MSIRLPVETLLRDAKVSVLALSRRSGIPARSIHRAKAEGGFTPTMADRAAVACGLTPGNVWPLEWASLPDGACGPVEAVPQSERDRRNRSYTKLHGKKTETEAA